MNRSASSLAEVPSHVPVDLVRNIDLSGASHPGGPYEMLAELHDGPRVFYNRSYGDRAISAAGLWVLTRAEDIRLALQQPEIFSSAGTVQFSQMIGENWRLIPLELDPPEHSQFR